MSNDANDLVVDVGRRPVEVELTAVRNATDLSVEGARQVLLDASPSDEAAQAAADVLDANAPSAITTQAAYDALHAADLLPGLHNLDPTITLNSAVTPMFRYKARDALSASWPAWGYGGNLTLATGSGHTLGLSGPFAGPDDGSLDPGAAGTTAAVYQDQTGGGGGDIATEDFILEFVLYYDGTDGQRGVVAKRASTAAVPGWFLQISPSPAAVFQIRTAAVLNSLSIGLRDGWNHLLIAGDRSGGSGSLAGWCNGLVAGSANMVTLAGLSCSNAEALTLFRFTSNADGAGRFNLPFSYAAGWKAASGWITSLAGVQALANARFNALAQYPVGS